MTTTSITTGSIGQVAQATGMSIAKSFLSADVIVLVDVSGSMDAHDSRGGKRRFDVAVDELAKLQRDLPGRIAVVAFSTSVQFVPGGIPPFLAAGTALDEALEFVQPADGTVKFIVISDGCPDDERRALNIAGKFESKIDTIFVGNEMDLGAANFLQRLASASGGKSVKAGGAAELAETVEKLLIGT
jgi:Mg-chelatase subunit ChlD